VVRRDATLPGTEYGVPSDSYAGIPDFAELALSRLLAGFSGFNSGLIAVTGFLGSEKSTTVAAMINHINKARARHRMTEPGWRRRSAS
jgi:Tfp pilus assembly ATPase PilU